MFTLFILHQWTSGAAPVVVVPDSEGLEYRNRANKLHYRHDTNKLHYRHDANRIHYRAKKE